MVNDPFKALSHPIRRGIVERLAEGPATVGVRHRRLRRLQAGDLQAPAGARGDRRRDAATVHGRTHRLSLDAHALTEAADWMDRQRALWDRLFDVVDEYLKRGRITMNTAADRLPAGVAGRPRGAARQGEGS